MDEKEFLHLYIQMIRSRAFEVLAKEQALAGKVPSSWMSGEGQEGTLGALVQLRADDYLTYTHRGAYAFIARGSDPARLLSELFGKRDGYCKGKGGRHIADLAHGIYGKSGTIGAHAPLAVGMGIAAQIRQTDQVVISLFGEGTSNRGTTHSALTASAKRKLPIVWICENNSYTGPVAARNYEPHPAIADLAIAYGFPGHQVDGNEVVAVHEAAALAIERARSGDGPSLLELHTYRMETFTTGIPETRPQEELNEWRARDPISLYKAYLQDKGMLPASLDEKIQADAGAEMQAALAYAEASLFPEPADAFQDLYG